MSIYNQADPSRSKIVSVQVLSNDRYGLVGEISSEISSLNIEIRHHRAKVFTDDRNKQMSMFEAKVRLDSEEGLWTLLHRLNKIKGVVNVTAC